MAEPAVAAIVLAAGSGTRLGSDEPKAFVPVAGAPLVVHAVRAASTVANPVIVAVPPGSVGRARVLVRDVERARVVAGGATRQASARAALGTVPGGVDVVVVHDAARPFATAALFEAVVAAVRGGEVGAIPTLPIVDTVKRVREGVVIGTEDRGALVLAQTPQAFRAADLRDAHARAHAASVDLTDDAAVMEWAGHRIAVIPGEPGNVKVTTAADLARADARG